MPIESRNPATGETLRTFQPLGERQIEESLARAVEAFNDWRLTSFEERARRVEHAARILGEQKKDLAGLMTTEMGKPILSAEAEVEKCAWACRFYARHAERFLADESVGTEAERSFIRYDPLGPILAIMPWNFPFWQVFRFAAPALMAGNVALLKHAPNVPRCALAIADVFRRAGFAEGVFQNLFLEVEQVDGVLEDARLRAVTLTGSPGAGSAVAARAGGLLKMSVLELGGSDPFIVMPSADVEKAADTAVTARCINNGQSCIAAKRIIVADGIFEEFRDRFVEGMEALQVGDPREEEVDIGPLAREDLLERLEEQVRASVEAGARTLTGGHRLERKGWYYAPTVLTDIAEDSPAFAEELFGPVASLFRVPDAESAVELANATPFGLGAAAWTRDAAERERFLRDLEAGLVFFNAMVASDPRLPFGGVKRSGYGRELGVHGIREFVNVKTVWIAAERGDGE